MSTALQTVTKAKLTPVGEGVLDLLVGFHAGGVLAPEEKNRRMRLFDEAARRFEEPVAVEALQRLRFSNLRNPFPPTHQDFFEACVKIRAGWKYAIYKILAGPAQSLPSEIPAPMVAPLVHELLSDKEFVDRITKRNVEDLKGALEALRNAVGDDMKATLIAHSEENAARVEQARLQREREEAERRRPLTDQEKAELQARKEWWAEKRRAEEERTKEWWAEMRRKEERFHKSLMPDSHAPRVRVSPELRRLVESQGSA